MIYLDDYASSQNIILTLSRLRIKLAQKKNSKHLIHLHSKDPKHNYHLKLRPSKSEIQLCSLFPSRKKWKKPGFERRFKDNFPLNTTEKNLKALLITVDFYQRNHPDELCMVKLNEFIKDVQKCLRSKSYKFSSPAIIPKLKEEKQSETEINICRPIASFELKDKIIIGITNKYLTNLIDDEFCNESFAFRAKRDDCGQQKAPTHHDPVTEILKYREQHREGSLWVSECDMKKFFDTVNHTVIKISFDKILKSKHLKTHQLQDLVDAKRALYNYLDAYRFNKNVLHLNLQQKFFKKNNIKNGQFGWVEDDLKLYYKRICSAKIGIPQGGALSGLIANVVLHCVDKTVIQPPDKEMLYVRYCDDMLIIHPKREICERAFDQYLLGLKKSKLVPHLHKEPPFANDATFWNDKSKKCYQWGSDNILGSQWIGFVGYEIHYGGDVRVRKSSLVKEMKKQNKVAVELKQILKSPYRRSSSKTIFESVVNRLIGMSVGRINLSNYQTLKNEMCWVSGYKLLTNNKYTRIQIRRLDSSRSKILRSLNYIVEKIEIEDKGKFKPVKNSKQVVFYGFPFSYYYHVLAKHNHTRNYSKQMSDEK
jgi:hypothetical protein